VSTRYVLGPVVGTGGMGVIHRAVADGSSTPVAVKQLRPELVGDPAMVARLETELRVGRELAHPNIARLIDFGDTPAGPPFLVMAWAEGEPLGNLLARIGALPERDCIEIARALLAALGHAHDRGIAHGDVKADNLLVTSGDSPRTVTLIDWGLARFLDEPAERATDLVSGTPGYMAPEVLMGDPPSIRSDLYAAGVVLYEMLTGSAPFGRGTSSEIAERQLTGGLEPPSVRAPERGISNVLDAAVMRALSVIPAKRFARAEELAAALDASSVRTAAIEIVSPRIVSELRALRRSESPSEQAVAASCLATVSALLEAHRLSEAASELEQTLARTRAHQARWPLLLSLAAIQSGLGRRDAAIRLAEEAREASRRAHAHVGEVRAEALLRRVAG